MPQQLELFPFTEPVDNVTSDSANNLQLGIPDADEELKRMTVSEVTQQQINKTRAEISALQVEIDTLVDLDTLYPYQEARYLDLLEERQKQEEFLKTLIKLQRTGLINVVEEQMQKP
jgi:hypothetical protein